MPRDRIPPLFLAIRPTNQPKVSTMNNARPSARQLRQFHQALEQAAAAGRQVRKYDELQQLRDQYLASLR